MLQEFDSVMKDIKGTKNQVVDHFSSLEDEALLKLDDKAEINYVLPYEQVLVASHDLIYWFPDFANYLASDLVPLKLSFH